MFLLAVFYISMAAAALAVEFLFGLLHLVPQHRVIPLTVEAIRWNYTAWLNLAFLALAALLVVRFFRTGGAAMLRMMHAPQEPQHQHTSQHGVHGQQGPQKECGLAHACHGEQYALFSPTDAQLSVSPSFNSEYEDG